MNHEFNLHNLHQGEFIGEKRFEIREKLGEGGFGIIYSAIDKSQSTTDPEYVKYVIVIVKVLDINYLRRKYPSEKVDHAKTLFRREINTMQGLKSEDSGSNISIPKLVYFPKSIENDNDYYFIMEYIQGETLQEFFTKQERLKEQDVISLITDIFEIVKSIHEYGVVHRDITPSNIMIREKDQKIFLIDFGIVTEKISNQSSDQQTDEGELNYLRTKIATQLGTEQYSLESQYNNGNVSFYNDIYSIGLIAIKALTGFCSDLPKNPDTKTKKYSLVWEGSPPISDELRKIIHKMIDYEDEHYKSVDEVLKDLKDLKQFEPSSVLTPETTEEINQAADSTNSSQNQPNTETEENKNNDSDSSFYALTPSTNNNRPTDNDIENPNGRRKSRSKDKNEDKDEDKDEGILSRIKRFCKKNSILIPMILSFLVVLLIVFVQREPIVEWVRDILRQNPTLIVQEKIAERNKYLSQLPRINDKQLPPENDRNINIFGSASMANYNNEIIKKEFENQFGSSKWKLNFHINQTNQINQIDPQYIDQKKKCQGSTVGIECLIDRTVKQDLASSSRSLTQKEKNKGLNSLFLIQDPIAFLVINSPRNQTIDNLTKKELQSIFRCENDDYYVVYGADPDISGTTKRFETKFLENNLGQCNTQPDNFKRWPDDEFTERIHDMKKEQEDDKNRIYITYGSYDGVASKFSNEVKFLNINSFAPNSKNYPEELKRDFYYIFVVDENGYPTNPKVRFFLEFLRNYFQ